MLAPQGRAAAQHAAIPPASGGPPMRRIALGLFAATLALATPHASRAAIVSATYSGSGGQGTGVFALNTLDLNKDFTAIGPIDVTIEVDAAGTYHIAETPIMFPIL